MNALRWGLSGAILWGVGLFILTWIAKLTGFGMFWLVQWMDLYPGYALTASGSIVGLVYAFVTGFIAFFLMAWLYNLLNKKS